MSLKLEIRLHAYQGPISQRVLINRTIDINRISMANRVLRQIAIIRNLFLNGAQVDTNTLSDAEVFFMII